MNINGVGWSDGSEETGEADREKSCFYPLRLSPSPNDTDAINLILLGDEHTSHYVLITDMSAVRDARCQKQELPEELLLHEVGYLVLTIIIL